MKFKIFINIQILFFSIVFYSHAQPTWNKNISCIIYSHCTNCHNPNGLAPTSLTTYNDVFNYRNSIVSAIENRKMPPHLPEPTYSHFANENVLKQSEIQLIKDWVNNGAPEGDVNTALPEPVYLQTEQITNPDLVVRIPSYTVPATNQDLYQAFVVSNPNPSAVFITSFEIIPGNRSIVHHVQVFQDTSYSVVTNDSSFAGPGYVSFGGIGSNSANLIGIWVPGSKVITTPTGMGIKLDAGARIVLQIHYPLGSEGKTDNTKVNFKFSNSSSLRNILILPVINNRALTNGPLFIPANTVKTFHAQLTIPADFTFTTTFPHGHLLCKSFECYGIKLGGDTIKLIKINDWDFHWQGTHTFRSPVKIPAGTILHCYTKYDNTTNNLENPSSPPRDVSYGENTTDEMMLVYFGFLGYQSGDENIIIDPNSHLKHYNDCIVDSTDIIPSPVITAFNVFPNPASHVLNIQFPPNNIFSTSIFNSMGQLVSKTENTTMINVSRLRTGIYYVRIYSNGKYYTKKIIICNS